MRTPSLDKIVFVLSACGMFWLLGYATRAAEWWPTDIVVAAQQQARAILSGYGVLGREGPDYVHNKVYEGRGVTTAKLEKVQARPILLTSAWRHGDEWQPTLRLIDRKGDLLHEWRIDPSEASDQSEVSLGLGDLDIQGSYLFDNGDVLVNLEYAGTLRVDPCGKVLWALPVRSHHSIARSDNGNFWIPGVTPNKRLVSPEYPNGIPGLDHPVYQDQILQISPQGTILRKINVLDLLYTNDLERHIAEERRTSSQDPTHLNDVEPLPDSLADDYARFQSDDLLVSLRNLELIFVFDPDSQNVKWHTTGRFILQHDPDFLGDGWIGLFDNNVDQTDRGSMLGGSRILAVHTATDSMKTLLAETKLESFYTEYRGKWQRLKNGNMLLTESSAGRVVEVDSTGAVVWKWVHPGANGRIADVTKAAQVSVNHNQVASWPCSPAQSSNGGKEERDE